jgi:hypothetical protein
MRNFYCLLLLLSGLPSFAAVPVAAGAHPAPRETLGAERLRNALASVSQPGARPTRSPECRACRIFNPERRKPSICCGAAMRGW